MEIPRRRQLNDILWGLFLLSHPGPVLFHLIAVTLFALLAAWPHVSWSIIALVIAAHTAMQLSIAMLNDYCDRRVDAQGKPDKPIPRGLVLPREALVAGLLMVVLMLILLIPLPPLAWICSLAYLALGQGYNLGLKSTPLSGIVFALAMPLIPLYAFAGVGHSAAFLYWLVPVGFLLGVSLNLANSLPDVEQDAASGARTLAVVLGVRRSFVLSQVLIVLSAALIGGLAVLKIVYTLPLALITALMLTCLSVVVAVRLFSGSEMPVKRRKGYFYLVALTCIVLVGGWLIGVFA
ncbi:MAG TPA: UbiA family prenyltransferase [Ktedonobacteraceae bacterium]|nr:UbiA family prenyltransferase [Ktedonobacteraceae bacterium]